MRIAAFVSSHGFGHASRACAVLDALRARLPDLAVDLYTGVEDAFFVSSLETPYRRIPWKTDVGLVQKGPFHSDLDATAREVTAFLDGLEASAERAAEALRAAGSEAVLCDISPLGIVAAGRAGLPSLLVENFRWDWIYGRLEGAPAALREAGMRMAELYRRADLHLQAPPLCDPVARAFRLETPVAREARRPPGAVRRSLGIGEDQAMVLVTTGGVTGEQTFLHALAKRPDVLFLVTGADRSSRTGNVWRLAAAEPRYLPDLVGAADAVVAKLGYSTLAEVWREGRPLLWVPRRQWPEGPVLARWAEDRLGGFAVEERAFNDGSWVDRLDALLALPPGPRQERAGQDEAAERILERMRGPVARLSRSPGA